MVLTLARVILVKHFKLLAKLVIPKFLLITLELITVLNYFLGFIQRELLIKQEVAQFIMVILMITILVGLVRVPFIKQWFLIHIPFIKKLFGASLNFIVVANLKQEIIH